MTQLRWNLLLALTLCLLTIPAMAQDQVPPDEGAQNLVFGGVRFNDGQISASFGYGKSVGRVIVVQSVDAGETGNWSSNVMATFPVWKSLSVGVLGGPEVDWGTRAEDDDSPIAYLVGAVGGLVSYDLGPVGVSIVGKYRDDMKTTFYEDGAEFGLVLYGWF